MLRLGDVPVQGKALKATGISLKLNKDYAAKADWYRQLVQIGLT
jgi:hypothetical protein